MPFLTLVKVWIGQITHHVRGMYKIPKTIPIAVDVIIIE